MKTISKIIIIFFSIALIFLTYLSIIGIETVKFNKQISKRITNLNKNLEIELNEIKIILNPFKFQLNIKTINPKLSIKNQRIEIEKIKTQISLESLIEGKFLINNLEISTKPLEINNLISFARSIKSNPQLFILEKTINKGYLIADVKLEFDSNGNIKDNYNIKGYVRDTKFNLPKKYNVKKLNFIFDYKKNDLILEDISFSLNNLSLFSNKISIKNLNDEFFVNGSIKNNELNLNDKNLLLFVKPYFPKLDIKKIKFSSENIFSFKINKKLRFEDYEITSKMLINETIITNNLDLKNLFPKIKENISLSDNEIKVTYKKEKLLIKGSGEILLQDEIDNISYTIEKKNNIFNFKTSLQIKENPFNINFLNYEKNQKKELLIFLEGSTKKDNQTLINFFSVKEKKKIIEINGLLFNNSFKIIDLNKVTFDYVDKDKQKNEIKLFKKNNKYFLEGPVFNASNLIDELLNSNDDKSNIFNINSRLKINVNKVFLDNDYYLRNFSGDLSFKTQKITRATLKGAFSDQKKFIFTINTNNNNNITTLYIDKAAPIVRRYKFIKGFEEGSLDFYSSKKSGVSTSTLKIYNFKLKEVPALTKILTLASLQGIADILSGEGIRFDEFEMNFIKNKNLITIDEIYAIGPAISILMDGYIEQNKLISLRGTLVPATTINKFIGSLPVLGKILVGSKTGEGVFGVSFKIKGSPKDPETTVNPIKTLTPRFITRTLEKIKKN